MVKDGQKVSKGDVICTWDPFNNVIVAEINGVLKFENVLIEVLPTVKKRMSKPVTVRKWLLKPVMKTKIPSIVVEGKKNSNHTTCLQVAISCLVEGDDVKAGQVLVNPTCAW